MYKNLFSNFYYLSLLPLLFTSFVNAQKQVPEKEKYGGTLVVALSTDPESSDPRYMGIGDSQWKGPNQI
jgi:hypothetical protein